MTEEAKKVTPPYASVKETVRLCTRRIPFMDAAGNVSIEVRRDYLQYSPKKKSHTLVLDELVRVERDVILESTAGNTKGLHNRRGDKVVAALRDMHHAVEMSRQQLNQFQAIENWVAWAMDMLQIARESVAKVEDSRFLTQWVSIKQCVDDLYTAAEAEPWEWEGTLRGRDALYKHFMAAISTFQELMQTRMFQIYYGINLVRA